MSREGDFLSGDVSIGVQAMCQLLGMESQHFYSYIQTRQELKESPGKFWLKKTVRTYIEELKMKDADQYLSLEAARRKEQSLKAELKEIELKKIEGDLICKENIKDSFKNLFSQFKSALLSIPNEVAYTCTIENDHSKIYKIIEKSVKEKLKELKKSYDKEGLDQ